MTMQQIVPTKEIFKFKDDASYSRNFFTGKDFYPYDREWFEEVFQRGTWHFPFPNTEEDNFAMGQVESFSQDDIGKVLIAEHGDVVVYMVT